MGACFSTTKDSSSSSSSPTSRSHRRNSSKSAAFARRRAAGYSVPEPEAEETVKEVLSETPKPRPPPKPRDDVAANAAAAYLDKKLKQQQQSGLLTLDKGFSGLLVPVDDGFCPNFDDRSEDASEAFSESLSASTATVTEKQDPGEAEKVRRRSDRSPAPAPAPAPPKYQRKRSVSGEFGCRRESSVAVRCGSGRSAQQSPARRAVDSAGPAVARTNSAREMGHAGRSRVTSGARREPGERSGRRSVSPAAKRMVEARHNATALAAAHGGAQYRTALGARTNGRASPRRVPPAAGEPAKQREEEEEREAVAGSGEAGFAEGSESLDNPLVSLECFIFL